MKRNTAFTLMELVVVIFMSGILIIPAYRIFSETSKTSIQGMQQIDMVLEGRRIIQQLRNDIKLSCIILPASEAQYSFTDFIKVVGHSASTLVGTKFSFLSFASHGELDKVVSAGVSTGQCIKCANEITYSLESGTPGNPFLVLSRTERVHPKAGGGEQKRILSRRINYFAINPVEIQSPGGRNQWFFNITLQLAEARQPEDLVNLSRNGMILNRQKGIMITDFFDLVCPTYFSAMWNQRFSNRNWHTIIQEP
ncbi:MAG: prepilin-type N-terminal cleavage/methylation domain-containing protein [Candidatus Riflebacteria bacterium]|nr:prepilin-type N-terminal cleavage/methylation domain-containing protein [Candidatus Riflebacteria bacterium]